MGRKTSISFNLRKQDKKTRKRGELEHRLHVSGLIDFFGDGWKEIKMQTEKRNINDCKKYFTD